MAKPSSAKTRRRTSKVRRTKSKSRRGGGPKGPNASYWSAYGAPYLPSIIRSSSSIADIRDLGGPKATRFNDMKQLEKDLIQLRTTLELEVKDPVTVAQMVNEEKHRRLAIINHNYPATSSRFGNMFSSSMARMSGIFKPRDVVYTIAELTFPHDHRHDNMSELMKGLKPRSIEQLKEAFKRDPKNITRITKKPNGDIFISYRNSHPLLGDRASTMIQAPLNED
jgi:hypothetical protein